MRKRARGKLHAGIGRVSALKGGEAVYACFIKSRLTKIPSSKSRTAPAEINTAIYEKLEKPSAGFKKICLKHIETAIKASMIIIVIVISFFIVFLSGSFYLSRKN